MRVGIEYEEWGSKFLANTEKIGNPDVQNTQSLSVWMCKQHNLINEELGKPLASCLYEDLKKRWGGPSKN